MFSQMLFIQTVCPLSSGRLALFSLWKNPTMDVQHIQSTPHLIRMRGPPCFPPITSHNMNCKILKPAIYRGEAGTQRNPLKSPQTIFSASVAPVYFACLLAWPTIAKAHFQHILNHVQKLLHSNCIMLNKNAKAGK